MNMMKPIKKTPCGPILVEPARRLSLARHDGVDFDNAVGVTDQLRERRF